MKHKRMAIAAALAVAGVVLLVTLLAGPDAPDTGEALPDVADLQLDTQFKPGTPGGAGFNPTVLHQTEHGELLFTDDETGRVTRLYWDKMTPLSRFTYDMVKPKVRIIFSPSRILEVTGDEGRFEISDRANDIQRGTLSGNVMVRLLETDDGSDVDLHSDRDEQLRMTLGDKAEFDMELGELTSESAIRVTGPRVEFNGYGLLLSYNRLRDRIDRLIIERNVSLRLRAEPSTVAAKQAKGDAEAATDDAPKKRPKPEAATKPQTVAAAEADDSEIEPESEVASESESEPEPVQFYLATFHDNVVVVADQRGTRMTGARLDATFTFEGGDPSKPKPVKRSAPRPANEARKTPKPDAAPPAEDTTTQTVEPAGEIFVTCDGRLEMEPFFKPEQDMRADPSAVLLALVGKETPAEIVTEEGETLTGMRFDYLTTTGRIRGLAAEGNRLPMRITSTKLGELTGRSFTIDPADATGVVFGPGSLIRQPASDSNDLPLHTTWRDQLDLVFFTESRRSGPDELLAIRTATFRGEVNVEHPELQLTSDTLTAHAERFGDNDQRITAIDAEGNVRMTAQRVADDKPMSITSGAMHVGVTTDEQGKQQPSRVTATGDVVAQQPGMTLKTQHLDAHLGAVPETEGDEPKLGVTAMTATGGVDVTSEEPAAQLLGERMTVDGVTRQMELFGIEGTPARALRDDAELTGQHLVMSDDDETIHVVGPGDFTFLNTPKDGAEPTTITVFWTESMHFDQLNGTARFVGDVECLARKTGEETQLTCDDLNMEFERLASSDEDGADSAQPFKRVRIRSASAYGHPVLASHSTDPADPDTVLTRFRLTNQPGAEDLRITFEGSPTYERAQVIGRGVMVIEDYRPKTTAASSKSSQVQVSGRGRTLFTWEKQLDIDTIANEMLMQDGVQMVHQPVGEESGEFGPPVTMSCRQLFADVKQSEGMDNWLSDDAPKFVIDQILAVGNVVIKQQQREAACDQLTYFGDSDTIILRAVDGKQVRIKDSDQPVPMSGTAFKWGLEKDTIELLKPGAITVPLRQ